MTRRYDKKTILLGLGIAVCVFPLVPLLNHLGHPELEIPSCAIAATLAVTVWVCRKLWRTAWFWIVFSVLLVLHTVLVIYFPWQAGWIPAPLTFLCCIADLAAMLGVIRLIENRVSKGENTPSEDNEAG